jgi:hypothetical protein
MINHSPAQLIAEIERLMDMDYERLPGARHVLEEAIAVIRPLAEKPAGVQMIDPLRALVAQFRANADRANDLASRYQGDVAGNGFAFMKERRVWTEAADALDALLSAPPTSA